jgi:hypothetical protein
MKHTPAPWGVDPEEPQDIYGSTIDSSEMELLASVFPMKRDGIHDSWKANARLIAAAPDMLDALTEIAAQLKALEGRQYKWIRERALKAIEKAV